LNYADTVLPHPSVKVHEMIMFLTLTNRSLLCA
jgi:hypothetical protein